MSLWPGVYFHDARITPGSDAHVECLQVGDINGLTIRNSTFVNCETHNVFISPWWTATIKDVLLENNFGGKVIGYYGFRIANGDAPGVCDNVVFRNNSATSPFLIECNTIRNGASFIANVGPYVAWSCYAGITFRYRRPVELSRKGHRRERPPDGWHPGRRSGREELAPAGGGGFRI